MKKKQLIFLGIFLACIVCITCSLSYAKYASNTLWNYYLTSKGFYFSSDNLTEKGTKIVNTIWDGNSIFFNIKNNLNDIVITDYDIGYKVTCTIQNPQIENVSCKLNGTSSNRYEGVLSNFKSCVNTKNDGVIVTDYDKTTCEMNGYEWMNQIATKDLYFDIEGDVENVDVNIIVTSTFPYTKTLSGNYVLYKDKSLIGMLNKQYLEYTDYSSLVITNSYKENKCATVTWDANKVRIDFEKNKITNYATDNSGYINEITFPINGKESIQYIFYKVNQEQYDTSLFTITEIEC